MFHPFQYQQQPITTNPTSNRHFSYFSNFGSSGGGSARPSTGVASSRGVATSPSKKSKKPPTTSTRRRLESDNPPTTPIVKKTKSPRANNRPVTAPATSVARPPTRPKTPRSATKEQRTGAAAGKPTLQNQTLSSRTPRSTRTTLSVVLPPRNISLSSIEEGEEEKCEPEKEELQQHDDVTFPSVKISSLHFEEAYTPHKAHWVKNALENLGTTWIREGKTTYDQLVSKEFEEKMGVFYDLAMAKKHEAIDRLVGEVEQEEIQLERKAGGSGKKPHHQIHQQQQKKKNQELKEVHRDFPFAEHLSPTVKASMSDSLLRIMTREENCSGGGDNEKKSEDHESSCASNSFERELKKRKSLVQCYVLDGGKLVIGTKKGLLGVGGSFINRFGDSRDSRVRRSGADGGGAAAYYRRTANMMGFLPHEIKIRYCRTSRQVVVSGARPQRGTENARQVREVLEVPKHVDVRNLVVLRTTKGSLIFEEEERE